MLKNIGIVKMTMLTVIVSILLSSVITAIVLIAFKRGHVYFGMFTASTCAIVIATPVSYYFFKIMEKLNTIQNMLMQKNQELADALNDVKELSGLLPICASCKKKSDIVKGIGTSWRPISNPIQRAPGKAGGLPVIIREGILFYLTGIFRKF